MSNIKGTNTKPEILLRKQLFSKGFRYRINVKGLPGKPDIVLAKYRTVIFIHGCFWHGHNGCPLFTVPKTNTGFWIKKISRNQERDQEVWRQLEAKGWAVIIVWECQLKPHKLEDTIRRVEEEIFQNGEEIQKQRQERKASRIAYQLERKARKEKEAAFLSEVTRI